HGRRSRKARWVWEAPDRSRPARGLGDPPVKNESHFLESPLPRASPGRRAEPQLPVPRVAAVLGRRGPTASDGPQVAAARLDERAIPICEELHRLLAGRTRRGARHARIPSFAAIAPRARASPG